MSPSITNSALDAAHADHLGRFGITPELLAAAGVRSVSDAETRDVLGIHGYAGHDLGGILFPYFWTTGNRVGARVRLNHPLTGGGKYISEPGCRHLFFPPGTSETLKETAITAVLVEAEKSALALAALCSRVGRNYLPLALGGCYGWLRKIGNRPLPNGGHATETGPSPDFDLIDWRNRTAIIAFDSNSKSNPFVRKGRYALAEELAARGAHVLIAEVPNEPEVNGPDDLIAVAGDEVMLRVLDSARPLANAALSEAERLVLALQDHKKKKAPPTIEELTPVIEAIAHVGDGARHELLTGRVISLRIPGVSRRFLEQQIGQLKIEAEKERQEIIARVHQGSLRAVGRTISGAELLDQVYAFVRRFVLLSEAQARIVALWIVHTQIFSFFDYTPYLAITSAEKQCGKTRLLEILNLLVAKPWLTGKVTAAVLYRKIDTVCPTLLLDESDAAFKGDEEYAEALRGVLNTGFQKDGKASCCVDHGEGLRDFSTFCPKAIAGIGNLPGTIQDRSISIQLKRAARNEMVARFRRRDAAPAAELLRNQIEAWTTPINESLPEARPELPEALKDRQQDISEPLLAIADAAGGEWSQKARQALIALFTDAVAEDTSIGVRLLSDIHAILNERGVDRIASADLVVALAAIETSPWPEYSHGKPITPPKLARLLARFGIEPRTIRLPDGKTPKGYYRTDFEDAWRRYLRLEPPAGMPQDTPLTPDPGVSNRHNATTRINTVENDDFGNATMFSRGGTGNAQNPNKNAPCGGVAVQKPLEGLEGNGNDALEV